MHNRSSSDKHEHHLSQTSDKQNLKSSKRSRDASDDHHHEHSKKIRPSYQNESNTANKRKNNSTDISEIKRQRYSYESSLDRRNVVTSKIKQDNHDNTRKYAEDLKKYQKERNLIERKKKEGAPISIFNYNKCLNILLRCQKYTEAENIYSEIHDQADMFTKVIMLKVFADQGKYMQAESLYSEISTSNESIPMNTFGELGDNSYMIARNIMLTVYINQRKYQEADKFFQEMGSNTNHFTKKIMARFQADQKKHADADKLRSKTTRPSIVQNVTTARNQHHHNEVLPNSNIEPRDNIDVQVTQKSTRGKTFSKFDELNCQKQEELIIRLRREGKPIDVFCYTKYLNLLLKCQRYSEADFIYSEIGSRADIFTKNAMLTGYSAQGNYRKAEEFFRELGYEADIFTKKIMLKVYAAQNKYLKAEVLFSEIGEHADIVAKNTIIKVFVAHGKTLEGKAAEKYYEKAAAIYRQIGRDEATIVTKNTMLTVYAAQKKYLKAEVLFNEIGGEADNFTINSMLSIYASQRKYAQAEELYVKMGSNVDAYIKNTMLNIYLEQCNYIAAEKLFYEIGHQANHITITTMLSVYANQQKYDEAERLFLQFNAKANINAKNKMLDIYSNQGRYIEAKELFHSIGDEADVTTKNTMIKVYAAQGKYEEAEKLFNELGVNADHTSNNTMITMYADQEKYAQAEALFSQLGDNVNIIGNTAILTMYVRQRNYEQAEALFKKISDRADVVTKTLMLKVYSAQDKYLKAKVLFSEIGSNATIVTLTTMLKLCADHEGYENAEKFFSDVICSDIHIHKMNSIAMNAMLKIYAKNHQYDKMKNFFNAITPEDRTVKLYQAMMAGILRKPNAKDREYDLNILDQYDAIVQSLKGSTFYRFSLLKLLQAYHGMLKFYNKKSKYSKGAQTRKDCEDITIKLTEREKVLAAEVRSLVLATPEQPVTILEAWLLSLYFPDEEFLPTHTPVSMDEITAIQRRAFNALNGELQPLSKDTKYTIRKVNSRGKYIGEYQLNDSIYYQMTGGELGECLMVEFEKPLKAEKIPLYLKYNGEYYCTDVVLGSRNKPKIMEKNYGGAIAIPVSARPYFKEVMPGKESSAYGQRAFFPEDPGTNNLGLQGQFVIGVVPDGIPAPMINPPFTLGDGQMYMRKSTANKIGLPDPKEYNPNESSFITYQATHGFSSSKYRHVVKELFHYGKSTVAAVKEALLAKKKPEPELLKKLYPSLIGSIPNLNPIVAPVAGENLVLPKTPLWEKMAANGAPILGGRSPHDSKAGLQVIKKAELTDVVMPSFQITLNGLTEENGVLSQDFIKGMVGVVDDEVMDKHVAQFGPEFAKAHIVMFPSEVKSSQKFKSAQLKHAIQHSKTPETYVLNGMMVIKQVAKHGEVVGMPEILQKGPFAGDYDGDHDEIAWLALFLEYAKMIEQESLNARINSKIPKSYTERTTAGNFPKLAEFQEKLLEKWVGINNAINYMPLDEREKFISKMARTHELVEILGINWKDNLGCDPDKITDEDIVTSEIQVGLKYGTDVIKTVIKRGTNPNETLPISFFLDRAKVYEKTLREFGRDLSVPYSNAFKRKLQKLIDTDTLTLESLTGLLEKAFKNKKSVNINESVMRANARFFKSATNDETGIFSDTDNEEVIETTLAM